MNVEIKNNGNLGVFLCQCGQKIASAVDLAALESMVKKNQKVAHADTLPYPCMAPGLKNIKEAIREKDLDRVVIAGCEGRILTKKFEQELVDEGLEQGQVEMVNLRDHVAQVHDGDPEELAVKGSKLIHAAVAGLSVLDPSPKIQVSFDGPVMVLGGGIATYSVAQELLRRDIDAIIAVNTDEAEDEIRMLHEHYPGERQYHDRLTRIMDEVHSSPLIKKISVGDLETVMGRMGDYAITFASEDDKPPRVYQAGAIVAALDGQMLNQGSDFGHDGVRVVCQTEIEEYLWLHGPPDKRLVFWINDPETPERPWAHLASRTAFHIACYIRENAMGSQVGILYNENMAVPLSAGERKRCRELGIEWIAYDSSIRPTVQDGYITYTNPEDNIEYELVWDMLCLSPLRSTGAEAQKVARILGFDVVEGDFLERNPQMVRPEQVGQEEKFLAGSARTPCDLREALRQGRRAAARIAKIVDLARQGELYAPRMVCSVDSTKCIGCGLCNEICDCGGIEPFEGQGGNIPRRVDPMVCTGGGTCAAACPYHALTLQNNSSAQREAKAATLARLMAENEYMGWGCNWGGAAAADHAGLQGMTYDRRFHLLTVGCIGMLDPVILGRTFLEGGNGLLLVGCPPEECHHSYGLDHTWSRANIVKKLLSLCGIERERIALAHVDLSSPDEYVRTVESFVATMDRLGPIKRDEATLERIRAMYDALHNPRVRWVLGAGLRRPYETDYPSDQRNAMAYDKSLSDVLTEEYIRVRVMNLLKDTGEVLELKQITRALGEDQKKVIGCLKELSGEGMISRIFKDRTPFYTLQ